jgi:2-polyprenyl-6-methoxyphenol hydroxylase-like FAD-dependent oxidoreductase
MATEDAVVLADEIAQAAHGQIDIDSALTRYAERRRQRVETIVRLSRQIGEEGQLSGVLACWLRNRRIRRESRAPERTQAGLERLLAWPPRDEARA